MRGCSSVVERPLCMIIMSGNCGRSRVRSPTSPSDLLSNESPPSGFWSGVTIPQHIVKIVYSPDPHQASATVLRRMTLGLIQVPTGKPKLTSSLSISSLVCFCKVFLLDRVIMNHCSFPSFSILSFIVRGQHGDCIDRCSALARLTTGCASWHRLAVLCDYPTIQRREESTLRLALRLHRL